MTVLFELIAQFVFEVLAYGTGRAFAFLLVPRLGVEPIERQRSAPRWKWRGAFTYQIGNRRFLYTESIQLLGIGVWLVVGLVIFVMSR